MIPNSAPPFLLSLFVPPCCANLFIQKLPLCAACRLNISKSWLRKFVNREFEKLRDIIEYWNPIQSASDTKTTTLLDLSSQLVLLCRKTFKFLIIIIIKISYTIKIVCFSFAVGIDEDRTMPLNVPFTH